MKASPNNVNYSREEIGLGRFESIDYRSKVLFHWHFTPCHGKELHSSRRQKRKINLRNNTISYAAGQSFGNDLGKRNCELEELLPGSDVRVPKCLSKIRLVQALIFIAR